VPSLSELARSHTDLSADDVAWLKLLTADWQIVADLSFADLVLWLPDRDGKGFWAGGQMRPTTGPTAYVDDVIGTFVPSQRRPVLDEALASGTVIREGDPEWRDDVPVRVEAIPVRHGDRVIAVIARSTNLHGVRTPSRLELTYLDIAAELAQMIALGHFPGTAELSHHTESVRVGDGMLRLDAQATVTYASPNALSAFRRLGLAGDLAGLRLPDVVRAVVPPRLRSGEESLSGLITGRLDGDTEIGTDLVTVVLRTIPLQPGPERTGALILLRDVTEVRRRDRELVTKDATIREVHHRVKNNLQTVAALLRLQARRIQNVAAKEALDEAVRRVGSIAVVHEILSRQPVEANVGFDEIADRLASMVNDVGSVRSKVTIHRVGSFGEVPSEVATALAMVLTELLQNAVEHGYPGGADGAIELDVSRHGESMAVRIVDDGIGFAEGFDLTSTDSLGLSIVQTLVESELGGSLELGNGPAGGAQARIVIPITPRGRD
jgi:two-component sensor histidine kinase